MATHEGNEVEIKFAVHDAAALIATLGAAGFQQQTPSSFESNTLYDTAIGELRSSGRLLRLRHYNLKWTLTHKSRGSAGRHKSRAEVETEVANGEAMRAILSALGYQASFRYEKYRAEWTDGVGEVVVDHTPIGVLAEIEGAPEWIDRTAHALGVEPSSYITGSYAELFFAWRARTGSKAENMTFAECGTPHPA